jgi:hypothetical protein
MQMDANYDTSLTYAWASMSSSLESNVYPLTVYLVVLLNAKLAFHSPVAGFVIVT